MAKRIKAEGYKVSDPDARMAQFQALLGKLVRVPKEEIKAKPKRKVTRKRKA